MASYQEARIKLLHTKLNKLKSSPKNKTGTISRISKKNLQDKRIAAWVIYNNKTKLKQKMPLLTIYKQI